MGTLLMLPASISSSVNWVQTKQHPLTHTYQSRSEVNHTWGQSRLCPDQAHALVKALQTQESSFLIYKMGLMDMARQHHGVNEMIRRDKHR